MSGLQDRQRVATGTPWEAVVGYSRAVRAGACILYAVSCGLSDAALTDQYDLLVRTGGREANGEDEEELVSKDGDADQVEGTGSKVRLKPWHQIVRLREDLRSGELSLSMFAADLYDVVMDRGPAVYRLPQEFFALTFPTFNLRELAKDVVLRLAGRNDRAVRQLVLTYGGGKTHALITLFHLVDDPPHLPDLPAVHEFIQHITITPPRARVAILAFDRLDPVTGMAVRAPGGATARFKYPWTVLAWQLGGQEGLRILGSEDGAEREQPPFTNVLEDLLRLPERDGLATLVLIDEVLMWARTKASSDPIWRPTFRTSFSA